MEERRDFFLASVVNKKTFLLESGRFFTREEKIFPVEATLLVSTLNSL